MSLCQCFGLFLRDTQIGISMVWECLINIIADIWADKLPLNILNLFSFALFSGKNQTKTKIYDITHT